MRTDFFLPPGATGVSISHLEQLPVNALMMACRDARFRRLVKWRGLARCDGEKGQFTSCISPIKGVFGLMREAEARPQSQLQKGCVHFSLHFFPDPEDDRIETLRLNAAILTQREEYKDAVRHFPLYPALIGTPADRDAARPFFIGNITLKALPDASGIEISLVSPLRRRIRSPQGVALPSLPPSPSSPAAPEPQWLIAPGDWEENAEGFALARRWFDVVAAALGTASGSAPTFFRYAERPCEDAEWTENGGLNRLEPTDNKEAKFSLVWGAKFPEEHAQSLEECGLLWPVEQQPISELPDSFKTAPWRYSHDLDSAIMPEGMPELDLRPGMLILTGFLGSGKTTLLNNLIEWQRGRERCVGVIQNEIGATGVDEKLLGDAASVVAMDEGCVCCTLAGNLGAGIRSLEAEANPEIIILETTGLANPRNVVAQMDEVRELARLEAVVTVADAVHGAEILHQSELARDQIRCADFIVLGKCDLATPEQKENLVSAIRELNPAAPLHESIKGALPPGLIAHMERRLAPAGKADKHAHSHEQEGFAAFRYSLPHAVPRDLLQELALNCPGSPFRIKGIVHLEGEADPVALQCVGKNCDFDSIDLAEPAMFAEHARPEECSSDDGSGEYELNKDFIVCIGRNLDAEALDAHWSRIGARRNADAHKGHHHGHD